MAESDEPVHLVEREETGDRFLIYTDDRGLRVDLRYEGDALWMTQAQMSQLFGIDVRTVNEHLQNVYREGELDEGATIRNFRIVRSEGARAVSREILHYNLDAVISVGYRVSSAQGTLFRKWATGVLVQFAARGFVVDVERLKEPGHQDRITELRDIIRDIRSSEANVYSELRRICAMCQDYDPSSDASRRFYQQMQAKLFYAVTNRTPADIVGSRSDADQPNMGLQTWSKAEVTKADAMVAKNYLAQPEIKELNRLTTIMLDIFDDQLDIGKLTTMAEAEELLERQLINLRRIVLRHGGNISSDAAKAKAAREYKRFDERRKRDRAVETARELAALKAADKSLPKVRAAKTKK
jgi:hypothetical protein